MLINNKKKPHTQNKVINNTIFRVFVHIFLWCEPTLIKYVVVDVKTYKTETTEELLIGFVLMLLNALLPALTWIQINNRELDSISSFQFHLNFIFFIKISAILLCLFFHDHGVLCT